MRDWDGTRWAGRGTGVDDAGLHHVSLILTGIGVVVLLMTVLDRHLAEAGREPGHSGRTARSR